MIFQINWLSFFHSLPGVRWYWSSSALPCNTPIEAEAEKLSAEKLGKKKETITLNSRLVEDLGADSLDVVELVMAFEDEFNISLPDEEVAKMKTVGDAVNYLKSIKK